MKSFFLLRHTHYDNPHRILHGRLPLPLTEEGRAEAKRVGKKLKRKKISRIYSSPVLRCKQTSEILGKVVNKPVLYDKRLLEVLTVLQGMKIVDFEKLPNRTYEFVSELGGETMRDVQVRMLDFFYDKMKNEHGNIVICSHGDPLHILYLGLLIKEPPVRATEFKDDEYPKKGSYREVKVKKDLSYKVGKMVTL